MRGRIEPIGAPDVVAAASIAANAGAMSARDLIHLAVMRRIEAGHVVSADRSYTGVAGVVRLDPMDVDSIERASTS